MYRMDLRLSDGLGAKLDQARGLVPKNAYVAALLEAQLEGGPSTGTEQESSPPRQTPSPRRPAKRMTAGEAAQLAEQEGRS